MIQGLGFRVDDGKQVRMSVLRLSYVHVRVGSDPEHPLPISPTLNPKTFLNP